MALKTIPIFKNNFNAGTSCDSNPIDVRDYTAEGRYSVYVKVAPIPGNGTAGEVVMSVSGAPYYGGDYANMGTFGTFNVGYEVAELDIAPVPFMKFGLNVGTSATVGASVEAFLHII